MELYSKYEVGIRISWFSSDIADFADKEVTMLKELHPSQHPGEPMRRWLKDDMLDLIVWHADDLTISGFQLCYDKDGREKAFTWRKETGYSHSVVDDGEELPTRNRSPILVPGGVFERERVLDEFEKRSTEIDPEIRELVLDKIRGCRLGVPDKT